MDPFSQIFPNPTNNYPNLFIQLVISLLILYLGISIVNYLTKKRTDESVSFGLDMKKIPKRSKPKKKKVKQKKPKQK